MVSLSLTQYTSIFHSLVQQCRELIKILAPSHLLTALEETLTTRAPLDEIYVFSQSLLFPTMPRKLLEDVLVANKFRLPKTDLLLHGPNYLNYPKYP